jgi:hypothetical protein
MSYGFLAVNQSGFTQIDGTYDNLAVLASGTGTTSYYSSLGNVANRVNWPTNLPSTWALFAKPSLETESGGFNTYWLQTDANGFYITTPLGSNFTRSFDWKICLRSFEMPSSPNTGYGLKVYKSNGDEAFSSNNENFKCLFVASDNTTAGSQAVYSPTSISGCFRLMNGSGWVAYHPSNQYPGTVAVSAYMQQFDYVTDEIKAVVTYAAIVGGSGSSTSDQVKTNLVGKFA